MRKENFIYHFFIKLSIFEVSYSLLFNLQNIVLLKFVQYNNNYTIS